MPTVRRQQRQLFEEPLPALDVRLPQEVTAQLLTAFQQVEDNLAALRVLENEAQQQHEATASAEQSLDLFQTRCEGGVDTYLQVVTWQTAALNNQRNDIDILQRRLDASVLLIKALGGGWDISGLPNP